MTATRRRAAAVLLALLLSAAATPASTAATEPGAAVATTSAAHRATKVLVVTIDALPSRALRELGPRRAPNLHRLFRDGAGTRNARSVRESTRTLPNHTTIVTGRRVDADRGGHGVWWNDERLTPRTVHGAAGHPVRSLFNVVHSRRRDTGLFVSKSKLALFERSWPRAVDRLVVQVDNRTLVRAARRDLVEHRRELTFLHLSWPDDVGHERGFLGDAHLAALERTDRQLGRLLATVEARPRLRDRLTLVLTSDHGGRGEGHYNPAKLVNHRVPFVVWGVGAAPGADLYELNDDDYRDPGTRRTRYGAQRPPVRNGDVANLVTDLLGLDPVPGSELNARQTLDVS